MGRPYKLPLEMQRQIDALRYRFTHTPITPSRSCPARAHVHPDHRMPYMKCVGHRCVLMSAKGLDDDGSDLPSKSRPVCGANTKVGGTCKMKVIPGKHRCKFHGGKSTGPRTAEGKQRIAEAQRLRWQRWRERKA